MNFIPEEEINAKVGINFAPMIDFLFLMVAFFACLAISSITTKDTDIDLVKIQAEQGQLPTNRDLDFSIVNINICENGDYQWVTEIRNYPLTTAAHIQEELDRQYKNGSLPVDKEKTHVLLKIDKKATWEPILQAILAIRDTGFEVHPVYEPE